MISYDIAGPANVQALGVSRGTAAALPGTLPEVRRNTLAEIRIMQAARPGRGNSGKQNQYRNHIVKLLKDKGLSTDAMQDKERWRLKLLELYPHTNGEN